MLEIDFIESMQKTILEKQPLIQIRPRGPINEIFEVINSMDENVLDDYIKHYCYKYVDSIKTTKITIRQGIIYGNLCNKIYPLMAPNSPFHCNTAQLYSYYPNAKRFIDKIKYIVEEIKNEALKTFVENNFVESIQKTILEKQPLIQIRPRGPINEIFETINSMDEKILDDYIRYYCYNYFDSIKTAHSKKSLGERLFFTCNKVYPLIAPNSPNAHNMNILSLKYPNAKRFMDKINYIGEEVKYEIFKGFIENKKQLKDLDGDIFNQGQIIQMITKYIQTDRDKFKEYIAYLIRDGLYKKSLDGKIMYADKEVFGIVSMAVVGHKHIRIWNESEDIYNIIREEYYEYCKLLVSNCVKNGEPLNSIDRCLTIDQLVVEIFLDLDIAVKQQYIAQRMNYYLAQRKMMNFNDFIDDCAYKTKKSASNFNEGYEEKYKEIRVYIDSLYDMYAKKLIEGNRDEITLSSDNWTLFFMDGPKVKFRCFKFDDIQSKKFRYEIKLYMMDECKYRINNNITLYQVKESVNFLYNRNKDCDSLSKIKTSDIRALDNYLQKDLKVKGAYDTERRRSINTIRKTMYKLAAIVDFLIKYSKKNALAVPAPKLNIITNVTYRNAYAMTKRTEIIPEIIVEQIDNFTTELNPIHQLMYEIFKNTGMRISSVCKLKDDCLKPSRYENVMILKYKPYKLKNHNKKQGNLPYEEIIITQELANKIQAQKDATRDLREKYNSPYIFLSVEGTAKAIRPSIISGMGFVTALNRITNKHNIVDYDGVVWHFTSRQFRKTLVSIMKDNDATDAEIAYVLGHHSQATVNRWYKEIDEQRIEKLNHDFFKGRFGIDIGEENLSQYSEEEKRVLYIDFVTNYRRVPLGFCSKPIADGPCDKMSGAGKCEKCSKICTGKQFIEEWIKLRDDRKRELDEIIEYYNVKNISVEEYSEYKEYKHILYEFNLYQDTIDKINLKCNEGE